MRADPAAMFAFALGAAIAWTIGRYCCWRWLRDEGQSFHGSEEFVTAMCMAFVGVIAGAEFVSTGH
jgi:drug/metabolite transporter superfamily protein YnfA